ncbi:MAG: PASTA domain-containing protein [Chloroflexi bacterium]|nr:PASTA domain-containing protein [Chloroflexota bacterium]
MGKLGEILRQARQERGLSLAQAEEATRIRRKFLVALEEEDYATLPGSVYVKGFLRNYATYLGLDGEEVLRIYREAEAAAAAPAEVQAPPKLPRALPKVNFGWVMGTGLVLLFALGMLSLFRQYTSRTFPAPTPEIVTPTPVPPTATAVPTPTPLQEAFVPDLVGVDLAKAEVQLQQLGLKIEIVARKFDRAPAGTILAQTVPKDTRVKLGESISVTVSSGPAPQAELPPVPNLVNMPFGDAQARLNEAGYKFEKEDVPTDQVPPGTVMAQEPAAGARLARGSTVRLRVSVGDVLVIPDVFGMPVDSAWQIFRKLGFSSHLIYKDGQRRKNVGVHEQWLFDKTSPGDVISQTPLAGTLVKKAATPTTEIHLGYNAE